MSIMSPVAMSQTKDDLLRHLNLPLETYNRMAKETDQVYIWLTSEKRHLKKNCEKGKPPYDWSDMKEKSKDEAMERIAKSKDQRTRMYWNLAEPVIDCPNWIARWFLYHKFRYRDGRNRNPGTASTILQNRIGDGSSRNRRSHGNAEEFAAYGYKQDSSQYPLSKEAQADEDEYRRDMRSNYTNPDADYHQTGSMSSGTHTYKYDADGVFPTVNTLYSASHDYTPGYTAELEYDNHARSPNEYWDPVRDARNAN